MLYAFKDGTYFSLHTNSAHHARHGLNINSPLGFEIDNVKHTTQWTTKMKANFLQLPHHI